MAQHPRSLERWRCSGADRTSVLGGRFWFVFVCDFLNWCSSSSVLYILFEVCVSLFVFSFCCVFVCYLVISRV